MSAYYTKVIPVSPFCRVDAQTARTVQRYLEEHMMAMSVEIEMQEHPAFIDCHAAADMRRSRICATRLPAVLPVQHLSCCIPENSWRGIISGKWSGCLARRSA